jgi:hypothetical protein
VTQLLDDLRAAATPALPKGVTPGITYSGRTPTSVTTPWIEEKLETDEDYAEYMKSIGVPIPTGKKLELTAAYFNQAAWHRDHQAIGTKDSAYTAPMWRYAFKVVDDIAGQDRADLELMLKEARKASRTRKTPTTTAGATMVINLADFQVGKTDVGGGTEELLIRSEVALREVLAAVRRQKPEEIVLVDNGDSTEGFESSPNAARTNDLQQTEQIRVWRRIFWRWITALAERGIPLKVVSVPSNHCRVRIGKNAQGPNDDDWGLEVLSQVADMASVNPERFEHVEFIQPQKYDEHVTLTLVGGKVISFAHGHQASQPNAIVDWAKKQGRRSIGLSDIVVVGHFHHFRAITYGDRQTLFICPTMDPGSSWFTPSSGEQSDPAILAFMVDEYGWRDLALIAVA